MRCDVKFNTPHRMEGAKDNTCAAGIAIKGRHTGTVSNVWEHFEVPPDSSVWAYYSRLSPINSLLSHGQSFFEFDYLYYKVLYGWQGSVFGKL